ncbi:MAG: hypothetical protein KAG86_06255 [Gammaproteobacteria bacterium]|nr:hypothetical protein [Gammaproteobacteria bacterium]
MPQLSKLIQSRENWKNKATLRATENRERRKQTKFHQKRIAELKVELKELELEHSLPDKKNTTDYSTNHKQ